MSPASPGSALRGTGLAAGKFDPPHRGHALLIDAARTHCERLIVLVNDYAGQTVPAQQRADWMREIHPGVDVRVILDDPRIAPGDAARNARYVLDFLGEPIDVLFTSEDHGEVFAAALGARHYLVDRERAMLPVTGTMVRRAPVAMLEWLEPCVRAYFVPRVCLVGSESTGKSSLCERLAAHYKTAWVPEYGRDYTMVKARAGRLGRWVDDEFVHIAFEQQRREDEAARRADRVLICDTDALASGIWLERYLERAPVHWPLAPPRIALYLLPYPDVPFVADEIRDGEHKRYWMYERFVEQLTQLGARFTVLRGTYEERDRQAIEAIDALLEHEVKQR